MDHTVGMKIVIEAEKGVTGRANGSSLNFAATVPGSQQGLMGPSKNDFRTTNQNSIGRLQEVRAPDSPAPNRNKNNILAGDSIFGGTTATQ